MAPDQPPLPTARNFRFQSAAGSQTSILMSESPDGVSVAATRQNAGSSAYARAVAGGPSPDGRGGANAPAATDSAVVIVAFGSLSDRSRSQLSSAAVA